MKKTLSLIMTFVLCLSFCACGDKNSSKDDLTYIVDNNNTEFNSQTNITNDTSSTNYVYTNFGNFSEGLAWVEYSDVNGQDYVGCINENGEMLFRYQSDKLGLMSWNYYLNYYDTEYENGYSYLGGKNENSVYVIDKNGDVCNKFEDFEAYGYGYVVTEEHFVDFDSECYEYTIYDANKNVVTTYKTEVKISVKYCGEGVFDFENELYFVKCNSFIEYNHEHGTLDDKILFNNGIAFVKNSDAYSPKSKFLLIESSGKIKEINNVDQILSTKRQNDMVYNDTVVFYDEDTPALAYYNVKDEKATYLNDKTLLNKLETHFDGTISSVDINPSFNENGVILSLVGTDNYRYVVITDYDLNIKTEPIRCNDYKACNNGVFVIDTTVYDDNGNILYCLEDYGYEAVVSASESLMFVRSFEGQASSDRDRYEDSSRRRYGFAVMDKEGNVVFDKIDTSNVVEKYIS